MKSYARFIFCLLIISALTTGVSLSVFAQGEKELISTKEVSGTIASVNLENSAIVVNYFKDEKTPVYESVTVYIRNSTFIEKDGKAVAVTEIKAGDEVTVEYAVDKMGKNIASAIRIGLEE